MKHNKNSRKPNGHAGSHGRVNGNADRSAVHAQNRCQPANGLLLPASAERDGPPVHPAHAASDDAGGATVASAAFAAAAGADRQEYAAAAPSRPNGAAPRTSRNATNRTTGSAAGGEERADKKGSEGTHKKKIPRGKSPLPTDPAEFVQEIHRKIDITEVWHSLLRAEDPRVQQRAAERLTDMFYKGAATSGDEPQQFVVDIESSAARSALKGANK